MASPDTGMKLVLVAGVMTFGNEWYQTHDLNWRVPIATVIAAAVTAGIGHVSPGAGVGIGVMALVVAATTPLNGKSPVQELSSVVDGYRSEKSTATTAKAA